MLVEYIDVLSDEQAKEITQTVTSLHKVWIKRGVYFYTLGAVSYLDGVENTYRYHKLREAYNPVLKKKFSGLYDIVLEKISEVLGPAQLLDLVGHPGFHIWGYSPTEGRIEQSFIDGYKSPFLGSLHVDIQYLPHMPIWNTYNSMDLKNTLSFTLALEMPESGSGLNVWRYLTGDDIDKWNYLDCNERLKTLDPPTYIPYKVGRMTYFIGHLIHQIPATKELKQTDRRITLQGHGVKCDGIWYIYF